MQAPDKHRRAMLHHHKLFTEDPAIQLLFLFKMTADWIYAVRLHYWEVNGCDPMEFPSMLCAQARARQMKYDEMLAFLKDGTLHPLRTEESDTDSEPAETPAYDNPSVNLGRGHRHRQVPVRFRE